MRIFVMGAAALATLSSPAVLAQGAPNPGTPPTTGTPAGSGGMQPQPSTSTQTGPGMPGTPGGPDQSGGMPGQAPTTGTAGSPGDRHGTMSGRTTGDDRRAGSSSSSTTNNPSGTDSRGTNRPR